jgi:uncharacterized protein (DUF4415 family)
MRKEYDLKKMRFRANPYASKLKQSVTIRLDKDILEYFKGLSKMTSTPYQTLVNDFLRSCTEQKLTPKTIWKRAG